MFRREQKENLSTAVTCCTYNAVSTLSILLTLQNCTAKFQWITGAFTLNVCSNFDIKSQNSIFEMWSSGTVWQIVSCVCVWMKLCVGVDTDGLLMLGLGHVPENRKIEQIEV